MTAAVKTPTLPVLNTGDRMGFLIVVSTIFHSFLILTLGFTLVTMEEKELPPTLEVVLVQKKSDEAPDDAKRIANEDNIGGGTLDEDAMRSSPFKAPFEGSEAEIAFKTGSQAQRERDPNELQILTADLARRDTYTKDVEQNKKLRERNSTNINELSLKIQSFADVLDRQMRKYAERPKREYISTRTKKNKHAAYMKMYEARVERTGNMHYPKRVKGEVVMNVGLYKNGRVESMKIKKIQTDGRTRKSVLKDAAKRIVRLATPFKPFTPEMGDVDILHITRTYVFSGNRLTTR